MKLIAHNMLSSPVEGIKIRYPLGLEDCKVTQAEADFDPAFVANLCPKLEYAVLLKAANSLGIQHKLPDTVPENYAENEEFLQQLHHVILENEVIEGFLVCPESGRKFPIVDCVPQMLVSQDQIDNAYLNLNFMFQFKLNPAGQ